MLRADFAIVILLALWLNYGRATREVNPDFDARTPVLAKRYGYPLEIHKVVTKDGYILELHRIPYGRNPGINARQSKSPVILQHGLAGSSADWIFMGPGKALGYFLADAGYDVWMGNNRGNVYSRNHTTMLPSDRYFWDFSYHELGMYDMPAMIDYILDRTRRKRLLYVGHSQGTTQFWVMTSQRPEYISKISLMVGLAPAAYTANLRGPVTKLAGLTYFGVKRGWFVCVSAASEADWMLSSSVGVDMHHEASQKETTTNTTIILKEPVSFVRLLASAMLLIGYRLAL